MYKISQIIGFTAFIISLVAYHRKEKSKIFHTMMVANVLDIIQYLLLGALSGCATKFMALVRNEIIVAKEKNKKLGHIGVLISLLIIYIIFGILTFKNIYSILPILAAVIYMIVVWNGDAYVTKKTAFYCYFLWLIYNICVLSIVGIVSNVVSIISTLIAVINQKKNKVIS